MLPENGWSSAVFSQIFLAMLLVGALFGMLKICDPKSKGGFRYLQTGDEKVTA